MFIQQFFVEGLDCASYLIGSAAQGTAVVVDPDRDVEPYLEAARMHGLRITRIIETHLHADHVSGCTDLAARTGAPIYIHPAAQVEYTHQPLADGDILELGEVAIRVNHTPGHTPESITLLVTDSAHPSEAPAALTGDLLFVGDLGRPDLVATNLPKQPGNHARIKDLNRRGPTPLGEITPKPLTIRQAIPQFQSGVGLLDTRSKAAYIRRHVPGSLHIEADDQLSSRAGLAFPPDVPLILMLEDEPAYRRVFLSLARVGIENIVGYLAEGIDAWEALGLPVASGDIRDVSPSELAALLAGGERPQVVDVREPWEFQQGHIAEAVLIPLGQLAQRVQELDASRPVAVVCASGSRSQSAAALLGQKGFQKIYNLYNGMDGWAREGLPVTRR